MELSVQCCDVNHLVSGCITGKTNVGFSTNFFSVFLPLRSTFCVILVIFVLAVSKSRSSGFTEISYPLMLCQFTLKCDLLLQCLHSEFFNLAVVEW